MCSNLRSSMHSWSTESATWILSNTAARGETVKLIPPHSTLHTPHHWICRGGPSTSFLNQNYLKLWPWLWGNCHKSMRLWRCPDRDHFISEAKLQTKDLNAFVSSNHSIRKNASLALALKPKNKTCYTFVQTFLNCRPVSGWRCSLHLEDQNLNQLLLKLWHLNRSLPHST